MQPENAWAELSSCRMCGWGTFEPVLSLGNMAFTGIFPKLGENVPRGPLDLVQCEACHLVQLGRVYPQDVLYGPTYGYRSGLNPAMVAHLRDIAILAWREMRFKEKMCVVDIGANDGTLLGFFPESIKRIGIDPLAEKFSEYWPKGSERETKSFPCRLYWPIDCVTTIACLYDAQNVGEWARRISEALDDNGIWIAELMLAEHVLGGAWDQICHEHAVYFGARQIEQMVERVGMYIADAQHTTTNGGSVLFVFRKGDKPHNWSPPRPPKTWSQLGENIERTCSHLYSGLENAAKCGQHVIGYGASTKGNVVLQRARIGPDLLPVILDVNPDKAGRVTPGTNIPIVTSEEELQIHLNGDAPDAMLCLPWHFRQNFIEKEADYLKAGGTLVFALPQFEVVTARTLGLEAA